MKLNIWAVLSLIFIGLVGLFALSGQWGMIGGDNDDVMRLAQIRDLLGGQNWYDHQQYRMGPEASATVMHWSRIIDIPIAALILFFDLFLTRAQAEAIALSVWPIMTGLALILGLHLLSKDHERPELKPFIWGFGLLILMLLLVTFYMFRPGRIDHHNVQLAALALSYIGLSSPIMAARRFGLAGAMTGLSLVIGTEALPFLAVNCGFVALLWMYRGERAAAGVRAFGLSFAAVIIFGFLLDTPPANYALIQCDILGFNYLLLGGVGGLGLAGLTLFNGLGTTARRLCGLAVLGFICAALLLLISPQCLSNPLGALPVNAQLFWLDHVEEANPLFSSRGLEGGSFLYFIGLITAAWSVSLWRYKKMGFTPARLYGLALGGVIIAMILYQIRYFPFGIVIGSFMLIPWAAACYVDGKAASKNSVGYIFALAVSTISFWQLPGVFLNQDEGVDPTRINTDVVAAQADGEVPQGVDRDDEEIARGKARDICFPENLEAYLNSTAPTLILAEPNYTSPIIYHTKHSALNGNYHRNAKGIDQAVDIFMQPPARAAQMMKTQNIGLLLFCKERAAYGIYAKASPGGLADQLVNDKLNAGFTEISLKSADADRGLISLWKPK